MIHKNPEIIRPETYQLLLKLQSDNRLDDYFLVEGTALALQLGHRHSIDLDLFSQEPFDENDLEVYLQQQYAFNTTVKFNNTLMGFVDNIKVDFITHAYTLVDSLLRVEAVRVASCLDIGAMKLNAIGQSGQRQKDFFDIYFLLEIHTLAKMLSAYEVKYPLSSPIVAVKSLTYFEDIRFEIEPLQMVKPLKFNQVKSRLKKAVLNTTKLF